MKKILTICFGLLICQYSFGVEVMKTSLHSASENILRFSNGRIALINEGLSLNWKNYLNKHLEVTVSDNHDLIKIKILGASFERVDHISESTPSSGRMSSPLRVKSFAEAENIFKRFNPDYQRVSQCYNRAHIWSYEEFKNNQIETMKTWIFFTNSYIRKYNFAWWFHVAPMVQDREGTPLILDYRYAQGPSTPRQWSDLFVYSGRECPLISKYSDYELNQNEQDCYLIHTSMYFWQPWQIKTFEEEGVDRTQFIESEVKWSYGEAF
jgi:hypothetical protein